MISFIDMFVSIIWVASFSLETNQQPTIEQVIFDNATYCEDEVIHDALQAESMICDLLQFDNAQQICIRTPCSELTHQSTEAIYASGILDIEYSSPVASTIFEELKCLAQQTDNLDDIGYVTFSEFFAKPGKIFCIDGSDRKLTMLSMNSCAEQKKFQKLLRAAASNPDYKRVLAINCGVDPRDVKVITK